MDRTERYEKKKERKSLYRFSLFFYSCLVIEIERRTYFLKDFTMAAGLFCSSGAARNASGKTAFSRAHPPNRLPRKIGDRDVEYIADRSDRPSDRVVILFIGSRVNGCIGSSELRSRFRSVRPRVILNSLIRAFTSKQRTIR